MVVLGGVGWALPTTRTEQVEHGGQRPPYRANAMITGIGALYADEKNRGLVLINQDFCYYFLNKRCNTEGNGTETELAPPEFAPVTMGAPGTSSYA